VNITLFEKEGRVGGRTLTIDPFGNSSQRVELGASIFIAKNFIMTDAAQQFGLDMVEPYDDVLPIMGIWDGAEFVLSVDMSHSTWWNTLKVIWKYGISAPRTTQKLMNTIVGKFLKLYDVEYFPFRSLTQRVFDLGLQEATAVTGEQFLKTNGVSDLYAHDIIQASTRVNYASNLAYIHGLDTMVSMAPEGAVSVAGGNWQIFQGMVNRSAAHVYLNTSVTSIALDPTDASSSDQPWKYVLTTQSSDSDDEDIVPTEFDNVVIAAPYQFSKIQAEDNVLQHAIDEIPYVELHVTIFSSPFLVSPSFFNLPNTQTIPGMILTTLGKNDTPTSGKQGAGSAGFFSINILRKVVNPGTGRQEYLYKIFSPEKITSDFLRSVLLYPNLHCF
jgi:prenylcysteine oxidase / farnesylcysteine lyase